MIGISGVGGNFFASHASARNSTPLTVETSALGSDNATASAGDSDVDISRTLRLVQPTETAVLSPDILKMLIDIQAQPHDASPSAPQTATTIAHGNAPFTAAELLQQARADIDSIFAGPGKDSTQLGATLTARLTAGGVDTTRPIALSVGSDGSILVDGDNPDKAKIEKTFADDPALGNLYRKVSEENYFAALGPLVARYTADYRAAASQTAGADVWSNYQRLFNETDKASGHLVLANGRLTSA